MTAPAIRELAEKLRENNKQILNAIDHEKKKIISYNAIWYASEHIAEVRDALEQQADIVGHLRDYIDVRIEHAKGHVGEGWNQVIRELEAAKELLTMYEEIAA